MADLRSYGESHLGDGPGGREKVITYLTDKAFEREIIMVPESELQKREAACQRKKLAEERRKAARSRSAPFALPKLHQLGRTNRPRAIPGRTKEEGRAMLLLASPCCFLVSETLLARTTLPRSDLLGEEII